MAERNFAIDYPTLAASGRLFALAARFIAPVRESWVQSLVTGIENTGEIHPFEDRLVHEFFKPEHVADTEQRFAEARQKFNQQGGQNG